MFIPRPFTEYTTEDFNALVSTTLAGFLYVSQLAVKQMLRQKSGSIVNVSTTLVGHAVVGVPAALQIMIKGGLDAVTSALAMEYAKDGIRVNTVAFGVIKTPMHKPETYEFLKELHPIGRMGEIHEVVDAILFLKDATFNRKRYLDLFKMNEQQIALFESLQDREALYMRRDGLTKVIVLNLDNRSYAAFSTKPKDRVRRSKLIAKYGLTEGITRFAQGESA